MCGIAGAVAEGPIPDDLGPAMAGTLSHRGPDDEGQWKSADGAVLLVHRRLSVLDLSPAGRNPMPWHGGRYWIVYNGEIYNFLQLRTELESAGATFRTGTDTEVVLAAYAAWGDDCVRRFNGMFAFAIWDQNDRRLFLARDPLGKKPLYIARYGNRLTFASEQRAIVSDPLFPRDIDRTALALYLRYGYVPAPLSIFTAMRKLEPGHTASYRDGVLEERRYWDPITVALRIDPPRDEAALSEELEALLTDAVRIRMVADVPVGAFLSGGIDSSVVTSLMKVVAAEVETFSIRFENPAYDESLHARSVAAHLGTVHHEETCGIDQMLGIVARLPELLDEPFADSSAVPTYLLSRFARRRVTVALTGDGGDEVFFGYPRYLHATRWLSPNRLPRPLRQAVASVARYVPHRRIRRASEVLDSNENDPYSRFVVWWPQPDVEAMTGALTPEAPAIIRARSILQELDPRLRPAGQDLVSYLPDDILFKVDRMSMAASLECRSPLLDPRVVEFGLRLPFSMRAHHGIGKLPLRRILSKKVPAALWQRPKMGFGVPLQDWFRGPLREQMESVLSGPALPRLGLDPMPAQRQWRMFLSGASSRTNVLWNVFVLAGWSERWT